MSNNSYKIIRNNERYYQTEAQLKRNPPVIIVKGTLYQAQRIAEILSSYEAGCDYYYTIEGEDEQ